MNLAAVYETVRRIKQCSDGTEQADRRAIAMFGEIVPEFAQTPYAQITSRLFAEFRARWIESGGNPATGNKHMAKVRSCLRALAEIGDVETVPVYRRIPEKSPAPRAANDDELREIIAACEVAEWPQVCCAGCYWKAIVLTGVNLGLRKQDIFALLWSAVDRKEMTVEVTISKGETGKQLSLPLAPGVLSSWEKIRSGSDRVFYSTSSKKQFYREWHRIQDKAGIDEHYTIHELRKTFANRIAETSGETAASELLGHSSIHVTRKHYLKSKIKTSHLKHSVLSSAFGDTAPADAQEELLLARFRRLPADERTAVLRLISRGR